MGLKGGMKRDVRVAEVVWSVARVVVVACPQLWKTKASLVVVR